MSDVSVVKKVSSFMFLHMFDRSSRRIVFIYPVAQGGSVHQLLACGLSDPDHRRTLPEIWTMHPEWLEIRVTVPEIRESKKSLRADRRAVYPITGISQSCCKIPTWTNPYRESLLGIYLRFIEGSIALAIEHAVVARRIVWRRDNKQGAKSINVKPGRKFLHASRQEISFLSLFSACEKLNAPPHCDSVGYVYVRAAFESCETKPLSVLALPRST